MCPKMSVSALGWWQAGLFGLNLHHAICEGLAGVLLDQIAFDV